VWVTARSTREAPSRTDVPGALEDTAEAIVREGGAAVAARCDHTNEAEVESLAARVAAEEGRLDVLVNNAWGGYEGYHEARFDAPFWEQPTWRFDRMQAAGVRAAYLATRHFAPLMMRRRRGLIAFTTVWDRGHFLLNVPYDVAKAAIIRMAYGVALELRRFRVASVAVAPGFMRTEAVLAAFGTDEARWREHTGLAASESPHYLGRALAALAADRDVMARSGGVFRVADLARDYGVTDLDGTRPAPFEIPRDMLLDADGPPPAVVPPGLGLAARRRRAARDAPGARPAGPRASARRPPRAVKRHR